MKFVAMHACAALLLLALFAIAMPNGDMTPNDLIQRDAGPFDANAPNLADTFDQSDAADADSEATSVDDDASASDELALDDSKCQIQSPKGRSSCQANTCRLASQVKCGWKNNRCSGKNLRGKNAPIACKDCKCVRIGA